MIIILMHQKIALGFPQGILERIVFHPGCVGASCPPRAIGWHCCQGFTDEDQTKNMSL